MDKNLNMNYNYCIIINYKFVRTVSLKILSNSSFNTYISTTRYTRRILALKISLVKKEKHKMLGIQPRFCSTGVFVTLSAQVQWVGNI